MHYHQVRAQFLSTDRGLHCRMMLILEMRDEPPLVCRVVFLWFSLVGVFIFLKKRPGILI